MAPQSIHVQWLLDQPEVASAQLDGRLRLGTIDSWLLWNLTGGAVHATDVTNASRTLLMDLESLQWDDDLMALFGVPREALPAIKPSSHVFGHTLPSGVLGVSVPIAGILGDQQAALVGQTCFQPGQSKTTYGTGNFLLLNTGTSPVLNDAGLLTTVAYQFGSDPCVYALEGSVAVTGSAIQWLRDQLGIISSASETETLARSVPDNGGVYFVPAFSGLYAPHWCSSARGTVVGLTRASTKAHLARAALESVCYQTKEVMDCMVASSNVEVTELRVDGGITANTACMQLQANIMGVSVILPCVTETTALGAAFAAGVAVGLWSGLDELKTLWQEQKRWVADAEEVGVVSQVPLDKHACDRRRIEGFRMWRRAVERSKDWCD
jgi:glycerol kinase